MTMARGSRRTALKSPPSYGVPSGPVSSIFHSSELASLLRYARQPSGESTASCLISRAMRFIVVAVDGMLCANGDPASFELWRMWLPAWERRRCDCGKGLTRLDTRVDYGVQWLTSSASTEGIGCAFERLAWPVVVVSVREGRAWMCGKAGAVSPAAWQPAVPASGPPLGAAGSPAR